MKKEIKKAVEFLRGVDPSMRKKEVIESIHEFSGEFLLFCIGQALKQKEPIVTNGKVEFTPFPLKGGKIEVEVYCENCPERSKPLQRRWIQFPSYAIPQIGDILQIEMWDEEFEKEFFLVNEKRFIFEGNYKLGGISLTVEAID